MTHSLLVSAIAGALLAATVAAQDGGTGVSKGIEPVVDERFDPPGVPQGLADPFVFAEADVFYITGTGSRMATCTTLTADSVQVLDLVFDFGPEAARGAYQVWGLKLYRHTDGGLHAYGTLHYGYFRTAIGHFIPTDVAPTEAVMPVLRWTLERILIGDGGTDHAVYDSNIVTDDDGALYLIYNGGWPDETLGQDIHIKAWRMTDPSSLDPAFEPRPILSPSGLRSEDRNYPGGVQIVEATHIHRIGGEWVLLYSVGDFDDGNYKLGAAFSDQLIPPVGETYTKVCAPDTTGLWGNDGPVDEVVYLLQTQHPDWPNYCADVINGPGLGNLVQEGDDYALIFHARHAGETRRHGAGRYVWRVPVDVAIGDGGPPRQEWIRPRLKHWVASDPC